jgi:hypothetical protein
MSRLSQLSKSQKLLLQSVRAQPQRRKTWRGGGPPTFLFNQHRGGDEAVSSSLNKKSNGGGGVRGWRPYCAGPTPPRIKKVSDFPAPSRDVTKPNYAWPGIIKFNPARESLISDILAGEGKIANLFLQYICWNGFPSPRIFSPCSQPSDVLPDTVDIACVDGSNSSTAYSHTPPRDSFELEHDSLPANPNHRVHILL